MCIFLYYSLSHHHFYHQKKTKKKTKKKSEREQQQKHFEETTTTDDDLEETNESIIVMAPLLLRVGGGGGLWGGVVKAMRWMMSTFTNDVNDSSNDIKSATTIVVACVGCIVVVLLKRREHVVGKLSGHARAVAHLVLSNEKKGLKALGKEMDDKMMSTTTTVGEAADKAKLVSKRTIYFVRHGESQWNYVFNRGFTLPGFPLRLMRGLLMELLSALDRRNSFFVDAPLSEKGLEQVEELRKFLNEVNNPFLTDAEVKTLRTKHVDVLRGDAVDGKTEEAKKSIIVTSNLRRAAHTAAIAFMDRFERTKEKLMVNDALQEMARNVDAFALAGDAFDAVPYTGITNVAKDKGTLKTILEETVKFNVESNAGNKGIRRRGATDCLRFAQWATSPNAVPKECETIIATGHSIYFREFFKLFLPSSSEHDAKSKKIVNCGVIAFELKKYEHEKKGVFFSIDEKSIETVYGGFVQKGKH